MGVRLDIPIQIVDEDPSGVSLSASATDSTVLPPTDIGIGGTGANRTLFLRPVGPGTTTIRVTATDVEGAESGVDFALEVLDPLSASD